MHLINIPGCEKVFIPDVQVPQPVTAAIFTFFCTFPLQFVVTKLFKKARHFDVEKVIN